MLADAFIVRMTLVPAVMAMLGDRAWWLPGWLDRILPNLDIEGEGASQRVPVSGDGAGPAEGVPEPEPPREPERREPFG